MTQTMTDAPPRPALDTLQRQQAELVDHERDPVTDLGCSLRHGFEHRRELLRWYQSATVRTFGALGEHWEPARLNSDKTLLQACITSDAREVWASDRTLGLEAAAAHRRVLEEHALLPAMHRAYNTLRKMAGEYIKEDDTDLSSFDPGTQEIAMRPAFSRKDREQRAALLQLWDGLDNRDDLRSWLHRLNQPTNGALGEDFAARVMRDRVMVDHLLRGGTDAHKSRRYREWFTISFLLPAFREGVERMDAGELAKRTSGGLEVAQG